MVNNHALRLVAGWNFSELLHARRSDSWTRASASETEPDREIANARKFLVSASNSSLKLVEGIALPLSLRGALVVLKASQQLQELVGQRRLNQVGIVRFERASDGLHSFSSRLGRYIGPGVWFFKFGHARGIHDPHPQPPQTDSGPFCSVTALLLRFHRGLTDAAYGAPRRAT